MAADVLGWYGRGNCGDDAFALAIPNLVHEDVSYIEPSFVQDADIGSGSRLILGGGDVIKSYYLDVIPRDVQFDILGCGLGYESELELLKGRRVGSALFRSRRDADLARQAGIPALFAPDLCFGIDPSCFATAPREPNSRKKLGVVLSSHPLGGFDQQVTKISAYFEYLQWELAEVLDSLAEFYDIYWVSFSCDPDAFDDATHYSVRKKMRRRQNQTFIPYSSNCPLAQLKVIQEMDLVLTMKFHGAIFATICSVPFVSIGLTRKMTRFCTEEDLGAVSVAPFELTKQSVLSCVKAAEDVDMPRKLADITGRNRALLYNTVSVARAGLG